MAYTPNIPAATDLFSASQPQIQGNFNAILASFDVNHVDFDAGTDNGKHKFISMPVQSPAPTFTATEIGMYSFLYPNTVQNELYLVKQYQATQIAIPITASTLSISSTPSTGTGGWTYLPSGLLMVWGTATGLNGASSVTLAPGISPAGTPQGFPGFTKMLNVQLTPFQSNNTDGNFAIQFSGISSSTVFLVYCSVRNGTGPSAGGCTYVVIGY